MPLSRTQFDMVESARARVGGEAGEDEPVSPLGEEAHQRTGLRVADEVGAAAEEARDHRHPGVEAREHDAEEEQRHDDPGDHEPFCVLECLLNLLAKEQQSQGGEERDVAPELHGARHVRSGNAADHRRHDRGCGRCRPPRPAQLDEAQDRPEPAPEDGPGLRAHEATHDRLTGVERVAGDLLVEDPLEEDRCRGYPQERRRELGRHSRPDQPFTASDRDAEDDRSRPGDAEGVLQVVGRWRGKLRHFPWRQAAGFDDPPVGWLGDTTHVGTPFCAPSVWTWSPAGAGHRRRHGRLGRKERPQLSDPPWVRAIKR
jgi:hypothetical protein